MLNILLITGKSGTGKSVISQKISKKIRASYLQSRAIARTLAHKDGFTRGRDWVRALGVKDATKRIQDEILHSIDQARPNSTIVIDGVYSSDLVAEIEKRVNKDKLRIIEITAPLPERIARSVHESGESEAEVKETMEFLDTIKNEAGIHAVENRANLVVENLEDESTLDVIYAFLQSSPLAA